MKSLSAGPKTAGQTRGDRYRLGYFQQGRYPRFHDSQLLGERSLKIFEVFSLFMVITEAKDKIQDASPKCHSSEIWNQGAGIRGMDSGLRQNDSLNGLMDHLYPPN